MRKDIELKIYRIIYVSGMINFIIFASIALGLGGNAVNGKIENGHYFLISHGHFTEVTSSIFIYSKWHTYSLFVTHPLAMLFGYLYHRKKSQTPH